MYHIKFLTESLRCTRFIMGDKNHNRLPINLPQLQNLIKRDKDAYAEEFNQQYRHYQALLQIFHLKPTAESKELDDIVMFLAQVNLTVDTHD